MCKIKFTIITVTYNSEKYIERTINSVINQSYPNIEYIIIDGASNDGTLNIIEKYRDKLASFVSEPDKNMYDAINKGMRFATGDYISILNSDDFYLHSDVISNIYRSILENPNYHGYYGNLIKYDQAENLIRKRRGFQVNYEELLYSTKLTFVGHGTLFIQSSCIKMIGEYDYLNYSAAADYDFVLRCFKKFSFKYLNIDLMGFRVHEESITSTGKIEQEKRILLERHDYYKFPFFQRKFKYYYLWGKFTFLNLRNLINKLG